MKRDLVLGWGRWWPGRGVRGDHGRLRPAGADRPGPGGGALAVGVRPAAAEVVASVLNRLRQGLWCWHLRRDRRVARGAALAPARPVAGGGALLYVLPRRCCWSRRYGCSRTHRPGAPVALPPEITVQLRGPLPPGSTPRATPAGTRPTPWSGTGATRARRRGVLRVRAAGVPAGRWRSGSCPGGGALHHHLSVVPLVQRWSGRAGARPGRRPRAVPTPSTAPGPTTSAALSPRLRPPSGCETATEPKVRPR